MPRVLLVAILLMVNIGQLFAQKDSAALAYQKIRQTYITDLTNKINIAPYTLLAASGFMLRSSENIRVQPNKLGNIGLRITHRWLSGAISFGVQNLQSDKKGTTQSFNLNINTYRQKWGFDAYYNSYKGQYIANKSLWELPDFSPNKTYTILPEVNTYYTGGNAYWVFNHQKFSYRGAFMNNEIQKKSAGSFLLMASYSFFKLNSDTGFVPGQIQPQIPITSQIIDGTFNSFSLMPGYAYTLVFAKRYSFTLAPSLGIMTQFQNYTTVVGTEGKTDGNIIYPRAMARAAFGYAAPKWYCGVSAIVDNYIIRLPENDHLIYNIGNISLYVGYRFNVPKKLRGVSKKINEYDPENLLNEMTH